MGRMGASWGQDGVSMGQERQCRAWPSQERGQARTIQDEGTHREIERLWAAYSAQHLGYFRCELVPAPPLKNG